MGRDCILRVEDYTASLDAALTLVPEGWSWRVAIDEGHRFPVVVLSRSRPTNAIIAIEHLTAPLAVVLAALRARGQS